MGVFQSCGWIWKFEMGMGALRMSCRSAKYPDPLKNLQNLPCIRTFSQTLQPNLKAIHSNDTAGLLNYITLEETTNGSMLTTLFVIFVTI